MEDAFNWCAKSDANCVTNNHVVSYLFLPICHCRDVVLALEPAEKRSGGSVPVYGSNGITGYHDEPLISDPCIVVGRKGSVGALQLAEGPSWTTDVAYYVTAPAYFNLKFLFFLLGTLGLENLNRGVKPGLSRKMAYSISIDVPPIGEQIRIVSEIEDAERNN